MSEVVPLVELRPIRHAPPWLVGFGNVRSVVVPVLDFASLLGERPAPRVLGTRIALLRVQAGSFPLLGLLAEHMIETARLFQGCVRLRQGNALELRPQEGPWDVILCRNLLIYLERDARRRLLALLTGLLSRSGVLVLGHADGWPPPTLGLHPVGPPGAFAFERGAPTPSSRTLSSSSLPPPRLLTVSPLEVPRREVLCPAPAASVMSAFSRRLAEARRLADQG
ncbi:MAG: CheR family methyltransferase, partial [Myxococcales bacterium]|nr:CheR family methyltransferase [Myxococcales bacterium]